MPSLSRALSAYTRRRAAHATPPADDGDMLPLHASQVQPQHGTMALEHSDGFASCDSEGGDVDDDLREATSSRASTGSGPAPQRRGRPRTSGARARPGASLSVSSLVFLAGLMLSVAAALRHVDQAAGSAAFGAADARARSMRARTVVVGLDAARGAPSAACRRTAFSPHWVADERGYVCKLEDVNGRHVANATHRGCCNVSAPATQRFRCTSCNAITTCCSEYEDCVSCCMTPAHERKRDQLRQSSELTGRLFASRSSANAALHDDFALCKSACATSSRSVTHENAYKHDQHHCFGPAPPPLDRKVHWGIFGFIRPLASRR